jgi:arylsulfatase A-like enzyme
MNRSLSACLLLSLAVPALRAAEPGTKEAANRTTPSAARPNIVFILSDDLGWGDLGCYGQKQILTPNIDRLAAEGMRFTNAYAGNSVCAPSRSCLMQGLHPGHARVRGNAYRGYREGLFKNDVTVAEVLHQAGYATGLFGKWGLGLSGQPDAVPTQQGFDEFFGYLNQRKAHSYYPAYLWNDTAKVDFPKHAGHDHKLQSLYDDQGRVRPNGIDNPNDAQYSFDLIHAKSLDFIRRHAKSQTRATRRGDAQRRGKPFFLYLAPTIPHGPLIVPELGPYKDEDWSIGAKEWAGMVTRLDAAVGDVLALLEKLDLDDNTLILFAADNGHCNDGYDRDKSVTTISDHFNNYGPSRGLKGESYDGAFRVPAVARWPGRIEAGQVSDHHWAFWDFLPTAAEVAGIPVADLPPTDGVSILPTLIGEPAAQKQHEYLYWEYGGSQAIRVGRYFAHRTKGGAVELYDLETDPQQRNNLAPTKPALAATVLTWMTRSHTPSTVWPSPGETSAEYKARLQAAGIPPHPVNIDG